MYLGTSYSLLLEAEERLDPFELMLLLLLLKKCLVKEVCVVVCRYKSVVSKKVLKALNNVIRESLF